MTYSPAKAGSFFLKVGDIIMKYHICVEKDYCICDQLADEPNEHCPIHGYGTFPPRCDICGRFMKWKKYNKKE